jgi:Calcineurin-like phosphoesterase
MVAAVRALALAALWGAAAFGQTVYTYIGQITSTSVLIAWGRTNGPGNENTIGRDSVSLGLATVHIADRVLLTDRNWIQVPNLQPDTVYPYEIVIRNQRTGGGTVRTWPARTTHITFFVLGDYGNGSASQRAIGAAMWNEFQKRAAGDDPVRFILTVGDNIYADVNAGYVILGSGAQDRDWERKFFQPYRDLLQQIPFMPSIGNHDGNASENRADLAAYLDNFFFPGNRPARWYLFNCGGLADFFALDSTDNTTSGHPAPAYAPGGDQSQWLAGVLGASRAPWKIPYFHHPPFNAGPGHGASYNVLRHWIDLFQRTGVKVVFNGHEHNFQYSEDSALTGHVRYVVSGAGGELRAGNVTPNMLRAHIEGWAPTRHFLIVEIEGRTMRITPVSNDRFVVRDAAGRVLPMPLVVQLP